MSQIIEPRVLKGFRDMLPEAEMLRAQMMRILSTVFETYGFAPIDTPVLEYAEILLGKAGGETEKQLYRFADAGKRDVAMRFDLTVPFARFMAEHLGELYLPFKRYHIAKVWRGENTQRGRYREFIQCDFDLVGVDSAGADFETISVIVSALEALGIEKFHVHINHRGIFNRFLVRLGLEASSAEILRIVDKLHKIGKDETQKQLGEIAGDENAKSIISFIDEKPSFAESLANLTALAGGDNPDSRRLEEIYSMAKASGIDGRIKLAPSITRGLDYYTGVVMETFLDDIPEIGSICSGGRYNDLASLYTRQNLPGQGASIGLDRLIAALDALGKTEKKRPLIRLLVLYMDENLAVEYQAIAAKLRKSGIACEAFPEKKKIGQQFSHAERKGARWALILGGDEKAQGIIKLRQLEERVDHICASIEEVVAMVKQDE